MAPFSAPLRLLLTASLFAGLGAGFTSRIAAQELRLPDGRVLVGKITQRGETLEVETRDGVVMVPNRQVQIASVDDLRDRLREVARDHDDSAFSHLQLAGKARDYGLEKEMWHNLDTVLEQLPKTSSDAARGAVERRLRDLLAQLEPELLPRELRQAPTARRVEALLRLFRPDTGPSRAAAIEELLVREEGADQELRRHARRNGNVRQRIGALSALQRRSLTGNDRFVLRTAVLDKNENVREAAIALGKPTVDDDDVLYMAAGLASESGKVRTRTAEALGALGQPSAIPLLVKAGPHAAAGLGGGGAAGDRAHVAFLNQQAYIRDFDVEVAQAAFIADPKIDTLNTGSVLDVTVAGSFEVRTIVYAYRAALKQLTSSDPGADPRRWAAWLEKLPKPGAAPTTGGATSTPTVGK
ncbi:MAG: hypothetical protein H6835_06025 [Planctomycetes bacterium]|nr:hypothetical protein [Planctomycetota bacterium]